MPVARALPEGTERAYSMCFTNVIEMKSSHSSDFADGMAAAHSIFEKYNSDLMPKKTNGTKRYQENFKNAAAEFVERTGQSVEQSAAELGVDPAMLRDWTQKLASRPKSGKPASIMAQLRAENEELRNQVLHLQVQWDILKTTLGVLSTTVCTQEAA
jgi:transposase-like protein